MRHSLNETQGEKLPQLLISQVINLKALLGVMVFGWLFSRTNAQLIAASPAWEAIALGPSVISTAVNGLSIDSCVTDANPFVAYDWLLLIPN